MSGGPDAVVIGGGAIGTAAALELAERGASVTLLERGGDLAWGCSAGNAGLICPSHAAPLASPAALRDGLRWMGKADSPFYLRPRASVLPWLARFVFAATPSRAAASALVIRELSTMSLATARRPGRARARHRSRAPWCPERIRNRASLCRGAAGGRGGNAIRPATRGLRGRAGARARTGPGRDARGRRLLPG